MDDPQVRELVHDWAYRTYMPLGGNVQLDDDGDEHATDDVGDGETTDPAAEPDP